MRFLEVFRRFGESLDHAGLLTLWLRTCGLRERRTQVRQRALQALPKLRINVLQVVQLRLQFLQGLLEAFLIVAHGMIISDQTENNAARPPFTAGLRLAQWASVEA